ncbi:MAG: hypothetical protein ACE5JK_06225 [Candidatus Omnitrophota bacterium]
MMERSIGTRIYGVALIIFGVYNLLGAGNFKQFSFMFKGLAPFIIFSLYVFTIFYGISCVYCGTKILRLEDWARKMIVALASISVILGFLLNRIVIRNLKEFLLSEQSGITPDMYSSVYAYTIFFIVIVTLFEVSIVFYFTRPNVIHQFKQES